jgi:hypothetical protein
MRRHELPPSSTQRRTRHVVERRTQWLDLAGAFAIRRRAARWLERVAALRPLARPRRVSLLRGRRGQDVLSECSAISIVGRRRGDRRVVRGGRPGALLGLPVARCGPVALVAALGDDVEMVMSWRVEHRTATGVVQPFTWVVVRGSSGRAPREGSR